MHQVYLPSVPTYFRIVYSTMGIIYSVSKIYCISPTYDTMQLV